MNQTLIGEDFRLDVPLLTRRVGPDPTASFAALFHAVDARRAPGTAFVLLVAGVDADATPATTTASGFARTAERALDLPVLFVAAGGRERDDLDDGNGRIGRAPDLLTALRAGMTPGEVARPTADPGISWAELGRVPALAGAEIARLVDAARESFAVVVIDSGGVAARSFAPALARHCDGALLVARAGRTDAVALAAARTALERAGGDVLGAVLDGDETRMPHFLASRL